MIKLSPPPPPPSSTAMERIESTFGAYFLYILFIGITFCINSDILFIGIKYAVLVLTFCINSTRA